MVKYFGVYEAVYKNTVLASFSIVPECKSYILALEEKGYTGITFRPAYERRLVSGGDGYGYILDTVGNEHLCLYPEYEKDIIGKDELDSFISNKWELFDDSNPLKLVVRRKHPKSKQPISYEVAEQDIYDQMFIGNIVFSGKFLKEKLSYLDGNNYLLRRAGIEEYATFTDKKGNKIVCSDIFYHTDVSKAESVNWSKGGSVNGSFKKARQKHTPSEGTIGIAKAMTLDGVTKSKFIKVFLRFVIETPIEGTFKSNPIKKVTCPQLDTIQFGGKKESNWSYRRKAEELYYMIKRKLNK